MRLYPTINDITIESYNKIQESFIKGSPDLSHLVEVPKEHASERQKKRYSKTIEKIRKRKHSTQLLKHYETFLYQMPEVDIDLNKKYALCKMESLKYSNLVEQNEHLRLLKKDKIKVIKYEVTKAFSEYLQALDKNYTGFKFSFHTIIENYKEEWQRIFKEEPPKRLIKAIDAGFGFFLIEEYQFEVNSWVEKNKISMYDGLRMLTPRFLELFIDSEIKDFDSLDVINKRLEKDFKDNNQFDKWFSVRFHFFDMNRIIFKAEKQSTILSEVIALNQSLSQNIDTKNTTVGQLYNNYRAEIKRQIAAQKNK